MDLFLLLFVLVLVGSGMDCRAGDRSWGGPWLYPERWRKLLLERSTWPAVEAYFANNDLVVLGFGSTENHGRHNPLGTDWMAPQRIIDLMDERRPEALYGPTLRLGSADHFVDYPGTLSLGDDLLYQVASRICGQLYHYGARHFCFVNGHGGNTRALTMTGYELNDRGCQVALLNWWKLAGELNPAWGGGHGGGGRGSSSSGPKRVGGEHGGRSFSSGFCCNPFANL